MVDSIVYSRICEFCKIERFYKTKQGLKYGVNHNKKCRSCASSGKNNGNYGGYGYTDEVRKKMGELKKGTKQSEKTKLKISETMKEYRKNTINSFTLESSRKKISEYRIGKKASAETKGKMRLAHLKRIEEINGYVYPNYNPEACKIIDEYGKKHGYNFQHAENGGEYHIKELGYFVDGYDKEKNVVIEYYEPFHKKQVERDERRKQEIIDHLGCKFIEIKE